MILNHRPSNICSLILVLIFILSSTAATFCNNLTSTDDKDTPCFLGSPTYQPALLRSSGNSLVLPCYVARSKHSTIEWWYQDFQKLINIKIYPIFPAVRPTVLRFITSTSSTSKSSNETDIIDVSVLLRHANVDDSGIYRCVIRPWTPSDLDSFEDNLSEGPSHLPALIYHIELTGPRLCHASLGPLPCFSNMRTSSPTVLDAYETAFLQCVVHSHNRPVTVFWVVGNASTNSVLITDYLTKNQHNGDQLRRVFPLSPHDYSIALTINRDTPERTYSCVIHGTNEPETTLFTYIVRSIDIDLNEIPHKTIEPSKNQTIAANEIETQTTTVNPEKIVAHDALTSEQVDELKHKNSGEHDKTKEKKVKVDDDEDFLKLYAHDQTSTTR